MTIRDLRVALLKGDVLPHLDPRVALLGEDRVVRHGEDAIDYLKVLPGIFDGVVLFPDEARATVSGTTAAGLSVKLFLYDGKVDRVLFKRPDPSRTRIRMTVAYDGTDFFGFQRQAELRSVQAELEGMVSHVNGEPTAVNGASRTDTGVHAVGQVVHFDSVREFSPERWMTIMNHSLPDDVRIVAAASTHPLFHARFDVFEKEYRYTVDVGAYDPLRRRQAWFPGPLDQDVLEREIGKVVGTHDFTSFSKGEKDSKVRTIKEARVEREGDRITLVFVGDGFLHNMIRLLSASLVRIAQGSMDADMAELIASKSRIRTQELAPAAGLCLMRVEY
ncbi:MAG: tRNA pseudouridine(38-40) synthase TruA [Candidatus Izemoplasmatales bacterium]